MKSKTHIMVLLTLTMIGFSLFSSINLMVMGAIPQSSIPTMEDNPNINESLINGQFTWNVKRSLGIYASNGYHADDQIRMKLDDNFQDEKQASEYYATIETKSWFNNSWYTEPDVETTDPYIIPRLWGQKTADIIVNELAPIWYKHPDLLTLALGDNVDYIEQISIRDLNYFDLVNDSVNQAEDLLRDGNLIYASYGNYGLKVIGSIFPEFLSFEKSFLPSSADGHYYTSTIIDDFLYVAAGSIGIDIYDIALYDNIHYIDSEDSNSNVYDLESYDDYLYVVSEDGLSIFQKEFDGTLTNISEITGSIELVSIVEDLMYLGLKDSSIQIYDLTDPEDPSEIGSITTENIPNQITVEGDEMFVAEGIAGFEIYDVSVPSAINKISTYNSVSAFDFDIINNYAYVANESSLNVLSIANLSDISILKSMNVQGSPKNFIIDGEYGFLASYNAGVYSFSVGDLSISSNYKLDHLYVEIDDFTISGQDWVNIINIIGDYAWDEIYDDYIEFFELSLISHYTDLRYDSIWYNGNYITVVVIDVVLDEDNYDHLVYSREEGLLLSRETQVNILNGSGINLPLRGNLDIELIDMGDFNLAVSPWHYIIYFAISVVSIIILVTIISVLVSRRQKRLQNLDY